MSILRIDAEAELARSPSNEPAPRSAEELLHELQVHQIELEMQNESMRQAMTALEESRDRYVDLYEFSPVGYLTLAAAGQIVEANLTSSGILGMERKRLLTQRFDSFLAEADRHDWRRQFTVALAHGLSLDVALTRGEAAPVLIHIHLDCRPLKSPDGTPRLRMALSDITARKQAEQALRESEELLRGYYTSSAACMGIVELVDDDLLHIYDNPATCRLFGVASDGTAGRRTSTLGLPPDFTAALIGKYRECAHIKAPLSFILPFNVQGQPRRWLDITVAPQSGGTPGSPRFSYFALDVTEVKEARIALEHSNAALADRTRQAEEASLAKGRFLSSISHELRTPLHTILGYVRLLKKESAGTTRQQLSIVERSSQQLRLLIDELLEFNQGQQFIPQLRLAPVALGNCLDLVARSAHLMALDGRNTFSTVLPDDLPGGVRLDEGRLLQVLQNLVGNACKYTREGRICLRVTREKDSQPPAGHCRLRFAVEDTGSGIPAEELGQLFEAFTRGSSAAGTPGLGLGLTVARQWVRAMGGDIEVRSHPGQGSCFSFILELTLAGVDELPPLMDNHAPAVSLQNTHPTVLVADDMVENRQFLRALCETWGCVVVEAVDGETALAACIKATPPIHMVLADQFMPGLDGWGLLHRLRENPAVARLPVALISASDAHRPADFPPGMNFDLILGKPLDDEALLHFLSERLSLPPKPLPSPVQPVPDKVALPTKELARFRALLDDGRVLDIAAWAQALAAADVTYETFATRVAEYCRGANLPALERLAAVPPAPDSPG